VGEGTWSFPGVDLTEAGDYQVDVHFVSESDRASNAPYTVFYDGGSKTYQVDQTGAPAGRWRTLEVHRNPTATSPPSPTRPGTPGPPTAYLQLHRLRHR
jgi:hypothetical protein